MGRKPGRAASSEIEFSAPQFDAWLDESQKRIGQVAQFIGAGSFHLTLHAPEVSGCPNCEVRLMCRQNFDLLPLRREACSKDEIYWPASILARLDGEPDA